MCIAACAKVYQNINTLQQNYRCVYLNFVGESEKNTTTSVSSVVEFHVEFDTFRCKKKAPAKVPGWMEFVQKVERNHFEWWFQ